MQQSYMNCGLLVEFSPTTCEPKFSATVDFR